MYENGSTDKSKLGDLVISEEVIASIAQSAAHDVEGVASFAPKPTDVIAALKGLDGNKYVNISIGDSDIKISLYIVVKPGHNIQTVAGEVQKAVKSTVQNMTGKVVSKINVTIAGLENG